MGEDQLYNQKDIQRYLQQQMSVEEMHAFEKVMMEDPFLADALEGYKEADESISAKHLNEIHSLISGAKEDRKVVPIAYRTTNWTRIAALFVLIAGISLITYKLTNNTDKEKTIASNVVPKAVIKNDTIKPFEPETPLAKADAFANKNIASFRKPSSVPARTLAAPAPVLKDTASDLITMQQNDLRDQLSNSAAHTSEESLQREMAAPRAMAMKQAITPPEIKGKVVDNTGEAVAGATVTTNNKNSVVTDKNGSFSIKAPDSILNVNVAAVGHVSATAKIKSGETDNKIILNENTASLSEVVVVGYGRKKEKSQQQLPGTPEPEGGWQNFNRYIDSSLNTAKANKEVAGVGDVELEFLIDHGGKPVDIKTLNTPDKTLEGKAIELIQKGPKWRTKNKKAKAKVVINF